MFEKVPKFESSQINSYRGIASISESEFCLVIKDRIKHEAIAIETLDLGYLNPLLVKQESKIELNKLSELTIVLDCENMVTVPKGIFSEQQLHSYLDLSEESMQTCLYQHSATEDHVYAYAMDSVILEELKQLNINTNIKHQGAISTETLLASAKKDAENQTYCICKKDHIWIHHYSAGQLSFCNRFSIANEEDFLYWNLLVCKQLEINPQECKLVLLGNFAQDGDLHMAAYQYFKKIQVGISTLTAVADHGLSVKKHEQFPLLMNSL